MLDNLKDFCYSKVWNMGEDRMYRKQLIYLLLGFILSGCGSTYYEKGKTFLEKEEYNQAVETLSQAAAQAPENPEIWQKLGIAYYKRGQLHKALSALRQANLIKPHHGAMFYLGLVHEQRGDLDSAISSYQRYLLLKPEGEMARKVGTKIRMLHKKRIAQETKRALAEEERLEVAAIPGNTIAVTYFDATGLDWTLAVLGKGLAEFLAADLSKVKKLEVVKRERMERLLEELEFGKAEYVDRSSAPRVGTLLGAYQLVTGSITAGEDGKLVIDAALLLTKAVEKDISPKEVVQKRLADLGYYQGEIDGKVGPMTKAAIKAFQSDHGLEADGIAGPKTREELKRVHKIPEETLAQFRKTGGAEQFFRLEKELALEIIDHLGVGLTQEEIDEIRQVPTESLPALLAYCRGLAYLDGGMYQEAADEFGKAVSADSNFQEARNQLREAGDFLQHMASVEDLYEFESAFAESEVIKLQPPDRLGERLSQTNENLSIIQSPSADNPHTQAATPSTGTVIIEGNLDKK
jgi:tetratricopeptide (TPR) repeat protein